METNLESDPSPSTIPPPQPEAPLAPNTSQPKMSTDDRKPRTLVLCFDGTANQFDGDVRPSPF